MVAAPIIGLALAYLHDGGHLLAVSRKSTPKKMDVYFRKLQLLSAAVYSYAHGTNDAQKTMGIITGLVVTGGYLATFEVPIWVILSSHTAIATGTLSGGRRIINTVGQKITKLKPVGGFCAEPRAGAITLLVTAFSRHCG